MKNYFFALNAWNAMNYQQRMSVLASLRYPTVLHVRAFPFLPSYVRQDLQRVLMVSQAGIKARQSCSYI